MHTLPIRLLSLSRYHQLNERFRADAIAKTGRKGKYYI